MNLEGIMSASGLTPFAEAKMWDLYKDHAHEAGSKYAGDKTGLQNTDCITYCINVISFAYEKVGNPTMAARVRGQGRGIELATLLVADGWKAHYWNPDVRHPRDNSSEHPYSYQVAKKTGEYQAVMRGGDVRKLKLDGFIIDYNLVNPTAKVPNNIDVYNRLSSVRFAFGIARAGVHTFLFSCGMVFEVHWDKIGPDLYERSSFYDYKWLSGALIVPPDEAFVPEPGIWEEVLKFFGL